MDTSPKTSKTLSQEEAYERASRYCARREHCRRDVEHKLRTWGVETRLWEAILTRLRAQHYLDEARFAEAFARDKLQFSGWGLGRIKQELQLRGIPSETIKQALDRLTAELDPDEQLRKVLRAKLRTQRASDPPRKRHEQLVRFGLYRGFSREAIERTLRELLGRDSETTETDCSY